MNCRALPSLLLLFGAATGCATPGPVQVPPEVLRSYQNDTSRTSRYVVRMTDGERDWEFQLPEVATAYEVRVPLKGKPAAPMSVEQGGLTAADRELIEARQSDAGPGSGKDARLRDDEEDVAPEADEAPAKKRRGPAKVDTAAPKGSYLLTMNKIKELYRTRHYELALVEIVALEQQYPSDERILSMKGSLYDKLGNKQLAKESWEQALRINPYNLAVMEALQRLGK